MYIPHCFLNISSSSAVFQNHVLFLTDQFDVWQWRSNKFVSEEFMMTSVFCNLALGTQIKTLFPSGIIELLSKHVIPHNRTQNWYSNYFGISRMKWQCARFEIASTFLRKPKWTIDFCPFSFSFLLRKINIISLIKSCSVFPTISSSLQRCRIYNST